MQTKSPKFIMLALFCCITAFTMQSRAQVTESNINSEKTEKAKKDTGKSKIKLFKDDVPLSMTLTTDVREFLGEKEKAEFQKATVSMKLPDSSLVTEEIEIRARGNFRREYCFMPSLMFNFKTKEDNKMASIGKLKMVCTCRPGKDFEQLVFKEYLCYKIFNMLTDMSYKTRLVKVNFVDSEGKKKPFLYYGFIIEDVDDMAKRNGCRELDIKNLHTELTDRSFMTLVNLYQYMIGNTDWSVPTPHNIKLIQSRDSTKVTKPYAIPYDFDYAGLVNAPYAVPAELLGTTSVLERVYRGFPRTLEEIEAEAKKFREKKQAIYSLISNFELLDKRQKDEMLRYLQDFFRILDDPKSMKREFVDNARTS
jgi:hypothetical protein